MANNLKRFTTESEYQQASLNYPAVSWITATDNVHFDKSAPAPTVNDKVMIASYGGSGEGYFIFYNCEDSSSSEITSITLDDVAVEPITCRSESNYDAEQVHIAKYTLNGESIGYWCSGDLGISQASTLAKVDLFIPSQIASMSFPSNVNNIVVEAEIPPLIEGLGSAYEGDGIYVPESAVNRYKSADEWGNFSSIIHPISEYQGNLPV